MDVNCIMACFCIFSFPNNHGIMAYIEFNCNKGVNVIYSDGYLTLSLIHIFMPPTPYRQIDTLQVARKEFGFSSNKLDALAGYLGIEHKSETNFLLWKRCLAGEQEALDYMQAYNIKAVSYTHLKF